MLRQRLVRQSALSSTDTPSFDSSYSAGSGLFRPVSSDSFEKLVELSPRHGERTSGRRRRHSVACGSVVIDVEKSSFKSAFGSAVRRMSNACSYLASSSQPTLGSDTAESRDIANDQVMLPPVLGTYRRGRPSRPAPGILQNNTFESNRRFSTDFAPPSYQEATSRWKLPVIVKPQKFCKSTDSNDIKGISFKRSTTELSEVEQPDLREVVSE